MTGPPQAQATAAANETKSTGCFGFASVEMEAGWLLAAGGNAFRRNYPGKMSTRIRLSRTDWNKVVGQLNREVRKAVRWWTFLPATILVPFGASMFMAYAITSLLGISGLPRFLLMILSMSALTPALCALLTFFLLPLRRESAIAQAQRSLAEINEKYREQGFDFSLITRKEYVRRYLNTSRRKTREGHMLVVKRLTSFDCGEGEHAATVPRGTAAVRTRRTQFGDMV
mmetsp:Transcript_59644/g.109249  ORF Transcript_59644/g.109249 Transcript_59644/m.109249 type:complete len:228 (+) Transcript_59644:64-747(+)